MCQNFYAVIVLLWATTSTNSFNEPVCDYISTDGKLRALGLHRRFDENRIPSYWLFRRDGNNTVDADIEYELSFGVDWNMSFSAEGVEAKRASHKFSVLKGDDVYNCSVVKHNVC